MADGCATYLPLTLFNRVLWTVPESREGRHAGPTPIRVGPFPRCNRDRSGDGRLGREFLAMGLVAGCSDPSGLRDVEVHVVRPGTTHFHIAMSRRRAASAQSGCDV